MYATQSKIVEEESFLFHKLGFDVYTAAWVTNHTTHFNGYKEFNPNHFYQGKCDFLSDDEVATLSKIDTNWGQFPTIPTKYIPEVRDVLLDKFDVLYVTAPTPWLVYAEDFLKAGKIVVFRPFGYAPYSWGKSINLDILFGYDKFRVVTCTHYDAPHYPTPFTAMTMVNKELFVDTKTPQSDYVFSIFPLVDSEVRIQLKTKFEAIGVPWKLHEYHYGWKSILEFNSLFDGSLIYLELNSMVRYPFLEAMARGKVVVTRGNLKPTTPQLHVYLMENGLDSEILSYYRDFHNAPDVVANLYRNPELRSQVVQVQSAWIDKMLAETVDIWKEVLEVNNG